MPKIPDLQLAQLLAPQRMEEQGGQDGAVALAADAVIERCDQQLARLVVADRRRLAFAAFRSRPFDAFDRVVRDGIPFTEIFLRSFPAPVAASVQYLQPVFGIAAAAAMFGDKLGPLFAVGVVLILAGLALAVANRRKAEEAVPHE